MWSFPVSLLGTTFLWLCLLSQCKGEISKFDSYHNLSVLKCRNKPSNTATSPSLYEWNKLKEEVENRLLEVIPSAGYCREAFRDGCTQLDWSSSVFRSNIPGAMGMSNWEQDYLSDPPSLCLREGRSKICKQGNVPIYAINATSVEHIQAGVRFAALHDLRVAIKASGHDFLGRSTARDSLLLWTRNFRNMTFTDSFFVGETNEGSAVTVGSGVPMNELYMAAKAQSKFVVSGTAATVVPAGGYVQGAGHSAFSPMFGLAADNTLQFSIVLSNGSLVIANEIENPDCKYIFWALKGGGAGSWGVIISATFRTFPIFTATEHTAVIVTGGHFTTGLFVELHARHIFDWDIKQAGQYFYVLNGALDSNYVTMTTMFASSSAAEATSAMTPFMDEVKAAGFHDYEENIRTVLANDLLYRESDSVGLNVILGSRLISIEAYKNNATGIGKAYSDILRQGSFGILTHLVAGGKVSENKNISNSVNAKWRTAKTHVVLVNAWTDSATVNEIQRIQDDLTYKHVPILASITEEENSGAYSNEADTQEPDFQTTFYGENYEKLKRIKEIYDPQGLFIVNSGVGSEDWDAFGFCRV